MATPGARTSDSTPSLDLKLTRIVRLLARAEARSCLAAHDNDIPTGPLVLGNAVADSDASASVGRQRATDPIDPGGIHPNQNPTG